MPTITLTAGDDTEIRTGVDDGLVDTIYGLAGNDSILGDGVDLNDLEGDLIYGGNGQDTIAGGFGPATVFGGAGDDTLDNRNVTASLGIDTVYGGAGNDSIFGKQADDLIYGGAGADNISSNQAVNFGAGGAVQSGDTVYGGAGDDTITTLDSTLTNSSSIGDLVYGGLGNDSILGAIQNPTAGVDTDEIFGGAGDDIIDGNGGNDTINAGAGNDTVLAADDEDTTDGGTGIDLIDFTNDSGAVDFDMTSGATTVTGPTGTDVESNINYENVIGTAGADTIDGNDENNNISGAAGTDVLTGGGGSDTFVSGAGDDSILGGETQGTAGVPDVDVLDYSDETAAGVVVTYTGDEAGTAQGIGTGVDTFAEIERIVFTAQDDSINASNDTVGVTLETGDGDDFVQAGQAADSLDGGDGIDTLSYTDSTDAVTLDLNTGTGTGGNAEGDTFTNFEFVQATANDDSIIGSGATETLTTGDGDDTVDGGGGNDSINTGEGNDTINGQLGDVIDGGGTIPGGPSATDNDTLDVSGVVPPGGSWVVVPGADPAEDGVVQIFDGPNGTGNLVGTITFTEVENIVCFTRGTMIMTPNGEIAIEDLSEGDMVMTRDNGAQPLRWIGSQSVKAEGKLAPVMIKAGALGNDRDLLVSQLHRMLISDWRAELMFDETEVLAAAKHLVNGDTIYVADGGEVEYFHMLFDTHEIVTANGAASESFHPGEQGMGWLAEEVREEIFAIFPQLRVDAEGYGSAARTSLKAFEARALTR